MALATETYDKDVYLEASGIGIPSQRKGKS